MPQIVKTSWPQKIPRATFTTRMDTLKVPSTITSTGHHQLHRHQTVSAMPQGNVRDVRALDQSPKKCHTVTLRLKLSQTPEFQLPHDLWFQRRPRFPKSPVESRFRDTFACMSAFEAIAGGESQSCSRQERRWGLVWRGRALGSEFSNCSGSRGWDAAKDAYPGLIDISRSIVMLGGLHWWA